MTTKPQSLNTKLILALTLTLRHNPIPNIIFNRDSPLEQCPLNTHR